MRINVAGISSWISALLGGNSGDCLLMEPSGFTFRFEIRF